MMKLPIAEYSSRIVDTVSKNAVTIITAETGAGKSTQVPQYLAKAGYRVLCTQPRRIAAATLAERVAVEQGCRLGGKVGFRTARDSQCSAKSRILFVTDGLALVRELLGERRGYDVLVVDEVHEWSESIEILVGWARREIANGAQFRLVIMSATLEAEKLAAYFDGAPIISVPGRCHPVEVMQPANSDHHIDKRFRWKADMAADISSLFARGKNVLAFLPGKREIAELGEMLQDLPVVELHGEQSRAEQRIAFENGVRKVVLATNVAQTSITIEDIDAVVDSGLVRQIEVNHGVEGLFLRPCSEADSAQRKGRAGRTRPGVYVDHCPDTAFRPEYQVPEIQRTMLDQVVLRLLVAGVDIEQLKLYHQPDPSEVRVAKETLRALGCIAADGSVTDVGRRIARLPVGTRSGRAIIEAERRGVVHRVTSALAVIEAKGIVDDRRLDETGRPVWRSHVPATNSDPLAFGELLDRSHRREWSSLGLHGKRASEAVEIRKQLANALRVVIRCGDRDTGSRDDAAKCLIIAEGDRLLEGSQNRWGEFVYGGRKIAKESAVGCSQRWMVGTPFDVSTKKGGSLGLLQMCTEVPVEWIVELFPERITERRSSASYDAEEDSCMVVVTTLLDGSSRLCERREPASDDEATACLVAHIERRIRGGWGYPVPDTHSAALDSAHESYTRARKVSERTGVQVDDVTELVRCVVDGATHMADIDPELLRIEFASEEDLHKAIELHPDSITIGGHQCTISYTDSCASVTVPTDALWASPDVVETPGGRRIRIRTNVGWGSYSADTASELLAKVEEMLRDDAEREFLRESDDAQELTERRYGPRDQWTGWAALGRRYRTRDEAVRALYEAACVDLPLHHAMRDGVPSEDGIEVVRAEVARLASEADAEAAELERNRSEVRRVCGDNISDEEADDVFLFVRDAFALRDDALDVLEREADAPYGRDRRTSSIEVAFPGIDHRGLDWKQGASIELVVMWSRSKFKRPQPKHSKQRKAKHQSSSSSGFGTLGDMLREKGLV
jgi:HrpA-like RNA helicase